MGKTLYLNYVILFVILASGVTSLLGENLDKSSHHQERQKRVIDKTKLITRREISIHYAPYAVNIRRNGVYHCTGVILSHNIVLTVAHCFAEKNAIYTVFSGSSLLTAGLKHIIQKTIIQNGYTPHNFMNDLAMSKVFPNIRFGVGFNRPVELHEPVIKPNIPAIFSGWGCTRSMPSIFPRQLTQTELSIMHPRFCQEHYKSKNIAIPSQHICAVDKTGNRGSCTADDGGPLVVDGNKLVGLFIYRQGDLNGRYPEVFMNVANPEIQHWILQTMNTNANWYGHVNG